MVINSATFILTRIFFPNSHEFQGTANSDYLWNDLRIWRGGRGIKDVHKRRETRLLWSLFPQIKKRMHL